MEEREIYIEQENNQEQEINIVSENIIMDGSVTDVTVNGTSVVQEGIAAIDLKNYATKEYVEQEIATFDFIKIVQELPTTGLPNRTYLVSKTNATDNDLYDEYIWVNKGTEEEPNWDWEYLGTKTIEVDLTDYVKKTDYADASTGGVVKVDASNGLSVGTNGSLFINPATEIDIDEATNTRSPLTVTKVDYAVKKGLSNNSLEWTDEEQTNACNLINAVKTASKSAWLAGKTIAYCANFNGSGEPTNASTMLVGRMLNDGIPRYNAQRLDTGTPTSDNNCANKAYVDGLIAQLRAELGLETE